MAAALAAACSAHRPLLVKGLCCCFAAAAAIADGGVPAALAATVLASRVAAARCRRRRLEQGLRGQDEGEVTSKGLQDEAAEQLQGGACGRRVRSWPLPDLDLAHSLHAHARRSRSLPPPSFARPALQGDWHGAGAAHAGRQAALCICKVSGAAHTAAAEGFGARVAGLCHA